MSERREIVYIQPWKFHRICLWMTIKKSKLETLKNSSSSSTTASPLCCCVLSMSTRPEGLWCELPWQHTLQAGEEREESGTHKVGGKKRNLGCRTQHTRRRKRANQCAFTISYLILIKFREREEEIACLFNPLYSCPLFSPCVPWARALWELNHEIVSRVRIGIFRLLASARQ